MQSTVRRGNWKILKNFLSELAMSPFAFIQKCNKQRNKPVTIRASRNIKHELDQEMQLLAE